MSANSQQSELRNSQQPSIFPVALKVLPDSIVDWPELAADFAIFMHRRILSETPFAGLEATRMAMKRTRVWWAASSLEAESNGTRSRRKQPDIEGALAILSSHKARLERSTDGMRVVVESGRDGQELQAALAVLGLDHLERVTRPVGGLI